MKVLLAYKSLSMGKQMAEVVAQVENVSIVGDARGIEPALASTNEQNPHCFIIDADLTGVWPDVVKLAKRAGKPALVVVTGEERNSHIRHSSLGIGADYFFELPRQAEDLRSAIADLKQKHAS